MLRRIALTVVCFVTVLISAGCWDRKELNELGFVIGIAIDFPSREKEEAIEQSEEPGEPKGKEFFEATYQIVQPGGLSSSTAGGQGNKAYFNISAADETMSAIEATMASKLGRPPFFDHLKIIIVSEDIARERPGFANVLDYFLRETDIRRRVKIMVTSGKASDILNVNPHNEKMPAMYVNLIAGNTDRSMYILPESRIGDVHEWLLKDRSFTIQRVQRQGDEALMFGAGLFSGKTNALAGFLTGKETEGLNFARGELKGGILEFNAGGNLATIRVRDTKRHIKLVRADEEHPKVEITVEMEGLLAEIFKQTKLFSEKEIRYLQRQAEKEIVRVVEHCIDKVQKEYKVDVFNIGAYLEQNHYRYWEKIKDDWEEGKLLFSECEVEVKALVRIRQMGTIDKSERTY